MEAEYAAYVHELSIMKFRMELMATAAFLVMFIAGIVLAVACFVRASNWDDRVASLLCIPAGLFLGALLILPVILVDQVRHSALKVEYADAIAWAQVNHGVTIKEAE